MGLPEWACLGANAALNQNLPDRLAGQMFLCVQILPFLRFSTVAARIPPIAMAQRRFNYLGVPSETIGMIPLQTRTPRNRNPPAIVAARTPAVQILQTQAPHPTQRFTTHALPPPARKQPSVPVWAFRLPWAWQPHFSYSFGKGGCGGKMPGTASKQVGGFLQIISILRLMTIQL